MRNIETFSFAEWPVEVHRRAHRRNITIQLQPHKPIKVLAAKATPQNMILEFLLSKKSWIEKNIEKFKDHPKPVEKKFQQNEIFQFLGRDLKLKPVITLNKRKFVSATDEHLLLHIPRNEWSATQLWQEHADSLEHIRQFYKREAVRTLEERTKYWAQQMNLYPKSLAFREQRTRWGSCSSRGSVNLNWRLIVFKLELIDYVIIHELAHLRHMDHSKNFWGLVAIHSPQYKALMDELKKQQSLCEFLSIKN